MNFAIARRLCLNRYPQSNTLRPAANLCSRPLWRSFQSTAGRHDKSFTNILADSDNPPPVQVNAITDEGIQLADGLVIPSACIFLEGNVFLWDVPESLAHWKPEHLDVFEAVLPRPEILLLGTGKRSLQPPPFMRAHLNNLGIQLDTMDTRNACSTYNLLSEEGRRVAAALLPFTHRVWQKTSPPTPQ